MLGRRIGLMLLVVAAISACWVGEAVAQQGGAPGGRTPEEWRQRMEEYRTQAANRMRESLGASEAEWKVLQPRIEKVQQLSRQTRGSSRGMSDRGSRGTGGRRPGESGRTPGAGDRTPPAGDRRPTAGTPERERTEIEKKSEALRTLLDDKASNPKAIAAALGALRKAREKAQQDLAAARKELCEVVTARQEAQLVLMGIVE